MCSPMESFIRRLRSVFLVAALLGGLALTVALMSGLALAAPSALGDPGNENWTPFSVGVSGGDVNAMAVDSAGNLYAGGAFTITTDGVMVTRTAMWNGATWSPLGSGLPGTVRAMAVDGSGNVYAGGDFPGLVAKWDGSTWSAVGGPIAGTTVRALAVDSSGNLYAGGDFTSTGTCQTGCTGIAKWDGSTWLSVGGGISGTTTVCRVNGLAFDPAGNNLYVAGQNECNRADPAGFNLTISRVARWNFTSSTWSALGAGASSNANSWAVDSKGNAYMAFGGSNVYNTGGVTLTVNRIAKWDPTANAGAGSWLALCNGTECGSTAGGTGRGVVVDNADNMYMISDRTTTGGVTTNYIAKWNPNANGGLGAWLALGSGLGQNTPRGLAYRDGNLYVGGGFTITAGVSTQRIARWTAAEGRAVSGVGTYNFYANNLPVSVNVATQGDLARINIQRFNTNHPNATTAIQTGYYWQIEGLNTSGVTATGYVVSLTLPTSFTADINDQVCRYTGTGWDCAVNSFTSNSLTRQGVTQFSDWAAGNDASFALTVTKTGTGSGTVSSTPAGIDCGGTCLAWFEPGTTVTLTATPITGTFGGWGGACLAPGTIIIPGTAGLPPQCVLPMTEARNVTVTFNKYFIFLPIVVKS